MVDIIKKGGLEYIECPNCKEFLSIQVLYSCPLQYRVQCQKCCYQRTGGTLGLLLKGIEQGKNLMGY